VKLALVIGVVGVLTDLTLTMRSEAAKAHKLSLRFLCRELDKVSATILQKSLRWIKAINFVETAVPGFESVFLQVIGGVFRHE
jgi:hypothetical protein